MNRRGFLRGVTAAGLLVAVPERVRAYSFLPAGMYVWSPVRIQVAPFGARGVYTFDAEGDIAEGSLVALVNDHTVRAARMNDLIVGMRVQPLCELWVQGLSTHPPRSQP